MTDTTHRNDVVIVGGGIIGIACAHYLTEAGMKVTVIDRGSMAGACSQGNCGYICASHILPLTEPEALWTGLKSLFNPKAAFRIRPTLRPELWMWMLQFMRRCNHRQMLVAGAALKALLESSLQEYHQLIDREKLACEWQQKGLLFVFKGESGMQQFAEMDRFVTEHFGVSANRIDGTALPEFDAALRPGLTGAFHYPNDASLRPDLLNSRWIENLRAKGVTFVENCSLNTVEKTGGALQALHTSNGRLEADRFIFATGAWSAKLAPLLGCRIPVEPGKGYSITMARPALCPSHPMLFPEKRVGVSPFEKGYRLGSMMEFSGFDASIPDRRIQQLRSSAEDFLVEPHADPVLNTWYGWRPMTWDSLPIIGQVPNLKNSYLATGHNMLGLATAAGSGRLLAELIQGKPTHIDPEPYSPRRF
jgi:D-amino-acid dehydrogenase